MRCCHLLLTISLLAGTLMVSVARAQQPAGTATLWSFLGIPQTMNHLGGGLVNRHGRFPGLEKKPPLLRIADPANLESPVKGIKAAAEIKQAEDLKKQKIKAVKYLTKVGCGCYDQDGKVTAALLESLKDCTEEVRLATVKAIGAAARDEYCQACQQRNCCAGEITKRLMTMAYDQDKNGCWIEPSARVRQAATNALQHCQPVEEPRADPTPDPTPDVTPDADTEGPIPVPVPTAARSRQPYGAYAKPARFVHTSSRRASLENDRSPSVRQPERFAAQSSRPSEVIDSQPTGLIQTGDSYSYLGVVQFVDAPKNIALLNFVSRKELPKGTVVTVYRRHLSKTYEIGRLQIVQSRPGVAQAVPIIGTSLSKIARGDGALASPAP
jgi:hypothetical protein